MPASAVDGNKASKARPTRLVRVNLDSWGRPSCCNAREPCQPLLSRPQWPQLAVPTTPGKWSLDWQMAKVWQPLSPTMICNPVIRQPRSYSPVIRWWQARTCYDLRRRLKRRRRGRCSRNKTQWGIWLILIFLTWKRHKQETRVKINFTEKNIIFLTSVWRFFSREIGLSQINQSGILQLKFNWSIREMRIILPGIFSLVKSCCREAINAFWRVFWQNHTLCWV